MNLREKNIIMMVGVALGLGIVVFAGYKWFVVPLSEYNSTIRKYEEDNGELEAKVLAFTEGRKKMDVGRARSLTAIGNVASNDYAVYLSNLLEKCDLKVVEVKPGTPLKVKAVNTTNTPGIKDTNHQLISFNVRVKGELAQIASALDKFQRTNVEHRIKSITIDRLDTGLGKAAGKVLGVVMVIETLVVAQSKTPPGTVPQFDPGSPERNYTDMGKRNPFMGQEIIIKKADPPKGPKTPTGPKDPDPEPEPIPDLDVTGYVRLTQTVPEQQEAYLRNLVVRTKEIKLIAKPQSGYDHFKITDEFGRHVFLTAKVLRVVDRDVYFQVTNRVFKLHIGQSVKEAMEHGELSTPRIDLEDLGLYDRAFADEQKELEKSKSKSGNTQKKTKGTKGGVKGGGD